MKKIPERLEHGCDCCHKRTLNGFSISTQLFLGYCSQVLYICSKCYIKMTKNRKELHNLEIVGAPERKRGGII